MSVESKLKEAGHAVSEAANKAGHKMSEGAEKAVEHPDSFDPLVESARGLRFLRAGLDALKRDAAATRSR